MIVVATDFSDLAHMALQSARSMARQLGEPLELVHVLERGEPSAESMWFVDDPEPGLIRLRRGIAWVEISRYAESVASVLLVVGSHGRSGYQPLSLGATAARLAVAAPCPTMIVGPRAERNRSAHGSNVSVSLNGLPVRMSQQ